MKITNKWQKVELGTVIDIFDSKRIPLSSTQRKKRQGTYPYYGASGVIDHIDDYIFDGDYLLVAEDGENLNSRKLPIAFWARGKFWVNNHAHIIRGKDQLADTEFLMNWFANTNIKGYITGSAQPKLSQQNLKKIKVYLPDINEQKRIAKILSTYNKLVENNSHRIKLLEQIAQAIYTKWFVRADDQIPEGWELKKLGELINIARGKNITKNTIREGNTPVVAGGLEPAYFHDTANTEAPVVTISASGANAGFVNLYMENVWASDCSFIDQRATPFVLYYFLLLKTRQAEVTGLQRGSAQPHVYPKDLAGLQVVSAPENILNSFEELVKPIFEMIGNLKQRNRILQNSLNILLPKLMTGEVNLKEEVSSESKSPVSPYQDAVILANLISQISQSNFYPTRLRCAKLHYFVDRFAGVNPIQKYAVKELGPYNTSSRYKGGERVAINQKYIKEVSGSKLSTGPNIQKALSYTYQELRTIPTILKTLRYKKDEELEILSTVDYAIVDITSKDNKKVSAKDVLNYISNNPIWQQKINRLRLSEEKILAAMQTLKELAKAGMRYPHT